MKSIVVRNVPDAIYKKLRIMAAIQDKTMKQIILELVEGMINDNDVNQRSETRHTS